MVVKQDGQLMRNDHSALFGDMTTLIGVVQD
jgi:hypothetical protein